MPLPRRTARYVNKNHDLLKGAVGWWKALPHNAGGAYLVNVLSPGQLLGARTGTTSWVGGPFGPCLSFDGTSGYVSTGVLHPTNITLALWFKVTSFTPSFPVLVRCYNQSGAPGSGADIYLNGLGGGSGYTAIGFEVVVGGVVTGITSGFGNLVLNAWYFAIGTYDGSTMNLYVFTPTGLNAVTHAGPSGPLSYSNRPTDPWTIGALGSAGANFAGLIDDVSIRDHALSSAEVYDLYRESRAGYPNLLPRRRSVLVLLGGGGTTYTASVTEAASAGDTTDATALFASSVTEAAAAIDAPTAAAVFASSVTEDASGSDTVSAAALLASAVSEAASGGDTVSAAATFAASVTENASAGDSGDCTGVFGGSLSEPCTATDTVTSTGVFGVAVVEAANATDTVSIAGLPTAGAGPTIYETVSLAYTRYDYVSIRRIQYDHVAIALTQYDHVTFGTP